MSDDAITEDAPTKGKKAKAEDAPEAAAPRKPNGQNIGDIVDGAHAHGGRYEAVGAGKYKRIA